jgi:hypothetical protein
MEHEERADELEREADKLEEHSQEVGERIEDTRKEWESKQQDQAVPGAQSYEALHPGEDNEEEDANENAGVPGEDEQSTGNPDAAGSEE